MNMLFLCYLMVSQMIIKAIQALILTVDLRPVQLICMTSPFYLAVFVFLQSAFVLTYQSFVLFSICSSTPLRSRMAV